MIRAAVLCLLAGMLLALAACTPRGVKPPASSPAMPWQERQQLLAAVNGWQLNGRVAMQTADDAWSGSIDWRQDGRQYLIRVSGLLGRHLMTVDGGPGYVVLTTADNQTYYARDAMSLVEQQTGWRIPVEYLQYWAFALPVPGASADKQFDTDGRLQSMQQAGWDIHYSDYRWLGDVEMPRKVRLENRHFKVKLVLKDWQPNRDAS